MYEWEVILTYGVHYVTADDYSVTHGRYIFWVGNRSVRQFPEEDVVDVRKIGLASTV